MGIKRYELDDAQWARITLLLPGKVGDPGRTGSDNRLFVNGCLWVLRSGAHWCDLPERYAAVRQCTDASVDGVILAYGNGCSMHSRQTDSQYLMIDSTIVRAHQQAATGKGGSKTKRWGVPEED